MANKVLVHPRKAKWAMEEFINQIHNLTYTTLVLSEAEEDLSIEEILDRFATAEEQEFKATCKMVKINRNNFCAFIDDAGEDTFRIGYNFNALTDKRGFRKSVIRHSNVCKGFANVTLALLHELGHFSSEQEFEDYDREKELKFLKQIPAEFAKEMYFLLPDELSATMWAVEWLQDAEHRKIAKEFEKKFFKCFK